MFSLSTFGQTYFLSLSFGEIRNLYSLSNGELGFWITVVTLVSGFMILLTGHWIDKYPTKRIFVISLPVLSLSMFLYQAELPFIFFLLNLFVLRLLAQGYMVHFAYTVTGRWFSARRGLATSLTVLGQSFGQMVIPVFYVSVSIVIGWHSTWMLFAVIILATTPGLVWLVSIERNPPYAIADYLQTKADNIHQYELKEVLRCAKFYFFVLAIIPMAFISNALFFGQIYLVEVRLWNLETFSLGFPVMAITTTIFSLVSGSLVDRYSAAILLPIYLIPLAIGCILLATATGEWVVFPFMALMGISNGFSLTLFGAIWPETFGTKHLGAIRALVTMIVISAASAGPGVFGLLLELGASIDTILLWLGFLG